jgi:hypothetical protein
VGQGLNRLRFVGWIDSDRPSDFTVCQARIDEQTRTQWQKNDRDGVHGLTVASFQSQLLKYYLLIMSLSIGVGVKTAGILLRRCVRTLIFIA